MDLLEWALATRAMYRFEVLRIFCLHMHRSLRTPGQHAEALVQFVRGSSGALGSKKNQKGVLSASVGHHVCKGNFEVTFTVSSFCYTYF